jgi:hypothetical protein
MNLIQSQAETFIRHHRKYEVIYKDFINDVRSELNEYRKEIYKREFIEHLINRIKLDYDEHLKVCKAKNREECSQNMFYENCLFFLQEEIEEIESTLDPSEFHRTEKDQISSTVDKILIEIQQIQLGQQVTYDDLSEQLIELKDYYFLNKRNWTQLFLGKMTEMIAAGVISEAYSKELVEIIRTNYPALFNQ